MILRFAYIILAFTGTTVISEATEKDCNYQDDCQGCLGVNYNCSWCTDKTYKMRYRCLTRDELLMNGCDTQYIWSNEEIFSVVQNSDLQDYQNKTSRAIQLSPQKIQMKLVKSKTQQIKLTYRPARNNPLDLYYLMDMTWTMRDDKTTLVQMGAQLTEALRSLTDNYRIGFGTFADKPAMPMIMPQLKENPCAAGREVCEPTYGFRHHLSFTQNISNFIQSVKDTRVTGNLDNLEGGLDALMQVIVCSEKIGWNEKARKIVVFVTDGFMHFAGDGLLAGINIRNDRKCHLDEFEEYLGSLVFDYPSLEEIYNELIEQKISIIFAVTSDVVQTYREMSSLMSEISNVEILSTDSSNIIELIKTSYETFLKRVKFVDDSPPFMAITYETNCGRKFKEFKNRNYCNDLKIGEEVDFYINITVDQFPDDGIYHRIIRIEEASVSEYLEIDIEIQPPCPCDEDIISDNYAEHQCNAHGVLQCGMCQCDDGWGGTFCSCDLNNGTTSASIEKECRQLFKNPVEYGPICSNRGECDCGTCYCFPGYAGKYCECPECEDCDLTQADCFCGRCVCKYGWSGKNCNCKESTEECRAPNDEICSQRGICKCGKCLCEKGIKGKYCEGESTDNKICKYYESCVRCLIQQKLGKYFCDNKTELCSSKDGKMFKFEFVENTNGSDYCIVRIDDNYHYFHYSTKESILLIEIVVHTPVNHYVTAGFISIFTFLIGLIIVIIVIYCRKAADAREFAEFQRQQEGAKLNESPIYKNPIVEYKVPPNEYDDNSL